MWSNSSNILLNTTYIFSLGHIFLTFLSLSPIPCTQLLNTGATAKVVSVRAWWMGDEKRLVGYSSWVVDVCRCFGNASDLESHCTLIVKCLVVLLRLEVRQLMMLLDCLRCMNCFITEGYEVWKVVCVCPVCFYLDKLPWSMELVLPCSMLYIIWYT